MRFNLRPILLCGLLSACASAQVHDGELQIEDRHADDLQTLELSAEDVTVRGQPVELQHIGSYEYERMPCQFRDQLETRLADWAADGMRLGPLIRSAEELDASVITCGSEIEWADYDLLVVELVARCCDFELIGGGAEDDELSVTVIQHNGCCGIEMYGVHREIYLVPKGFTLARLDLHVSPADCGGLEETVP